LLEELARTSWGKFVAFLSTKTHDIAAAEDAVAEAFRIAVERWRDEGVPPNPEAWLLHVAHKRLTDSFRRSITREKAVPQLVRDSDAAQLRSDEEAIETMETIPDERLKLLFVCAHPAIDSSIRTPLMLQTVLGLDAIRIAKAFALSPEAMSQRLVRAKTKIREAAIPFSVPHVHQLSERLSAVLDAIYVAYGTGWEEEHGKSVPVQQSLVAEALWLARLLSNLQPDSAETKGLLALMLFLESRKEARFDSHTGFFVPLEEQDTGLWNDPLIREAETTLREASALGNPGPYQWMAAIQSIHCSRKYTGQLPWSVILQLYEALQYAKPTLGVQLGRILPLYHTHGLEAAWNALQSLPMERVETHQPYWAVRAFLLRSSGKTNEARSAYEKAASLTNDERLKGYLLTQRMLLAD
ncbi:MAG: DUF6596 domain-containing protein, partial [Candidatus Sumerlaeia bacterium]|nr:DUF6596 domain-containing protein [Candidatus Sumerlaeia bacterium]